MVATEVNGDPEAMSAFSTQLTAPALPPSMARLGTPPNLSGLFEGIAMSLLDKAATAELNAFLMKITHDLITFSTDAKEVAATYTAADVAGALDLAAATAKLAQQGIALVKQFADSQAALQSAGESTEKSTAESAGGAPQTTA